MVFGREIVSVASYEAKVAVCVASPKDLFLVRASSKKLLPQVSHYVLSQIINISDIYCEITPLLNCSNEMLLMTSYKCKVGLLQTLVNVFDQHCINTLVIESLPSDCSFMATIIPQLHSDKFLVLWLSEVYGVHAWTTRCIRIERCHAT